MRSLIARCGCLGLLALGAIAGAACSSPPTYSLWQTQRAWPESLADAGPPEVAVVELDRGLRRGECDLARDRSVRSLTYYLGHDGQRSPDGGRYRLDGRVIDTTLLCLVTGEHPQAVAGEVRRRLPRWAGAVPMTIIVSAGAFWLATVRGVGLTAYAGVAMALMAGAAVTALWFR